MNRQKESGTALITAIFCVFIIAMSFAAIFDLTNQSIKENRNIGNRVNAKMVATGGLEKAISWIGNTPTVSLASMPASVSYGTIGSGSYDVTANMIDPARGFFFMESTGLLNSVIAKSRIYIQKPVDNTQALRMGVFSNDSISSNGSANKIGKPDLPVDIFSNKNINFPGTLYGNASAVGTINIGNMATGGTKKTGSSAMSFPNIDADYYYKLAFSSASTDIVDVSVIAGGGTFTPVSGVLWVTSTSPTTVKYQGNKSLTVNGTLVLNNVGITTLGNSGISITPKSGPKGKMPALIVLGGDVDLGGNSNAIPGMMYINPGNLYLHGTSDLYSRVISWGPVILGGTPSIQPGSVDDIVLIPTDTQCSVIFWEE